MCLSVCVCLYLCLSASVSGFFRRDYIASRSDNPKKHADLSFSISLSLWLELRVSESARFCMLTHARMRVCDPCPPLYVRARVSVHARVNTHACVRACGSYC